MKWMPDNETLSTIYTSNAEAKKVQEEKESLREPGWNRNETPGIDKVYSTMAPAEARAGIAARKEAAIKEREEAYARGEADASLIMYPSTM